MDILNMNEFAVHPRVITAEGKVDTVTVMPKRRVTLPDDYMVDSNWLASMPRVSVYGSSVCRKPLVTSQGTQVLSAKIPMGPGVHGGGFANEFADPEAQAKAIALAQAQSVAAAQHAAALQRALAPSTDAAPGTETN